LPLVHRFSGPAFAPSYSRDAGPEHCPQCEGRVAVFDPSRRCCLDRYEALFGSAREHRDVIARALQAALVGDMGPARRLVESYRRVFGPMEAVELRRLLWREIGTGRSGPGLASAA
jgi:hypothetical protein